LHPRLGLQAMKVSQKVPQRWHHVRKPAAKLA
jgi:hypothetical protein